MVYDMNALAELLFDKNVIIYVCGSVAVGEAVKDFIIRTYKEKKGLMPYLAYSKIS